MEFLPPYSPDFNPIEEDFGVLERFIKKKRHENEDFIARELSGTPRISNTLSRRMTSAATLLFLNWG